jgi:20S proteasome subunit alpha 5
MSGLTADARTMIDHARIETQNHRFTYNEPMTTESCTQSICNLALRFGEDDEDDEGEEGGMSRPFGVALLIAGVDEKGPCLYHTDPSGTFVRYEAKAIGAASEGAQTTLQEKYEKNMTLEEAEDLAIIILKQVMEFKINPKNVEIGSVTVKDPTFRIYSESKIEKIIKRN